MTAATAPASIIRFTPPRASESAMQVDINYLMLTLVCGGIILLLGVLVLWFAIRYRAGSDADRTDRFDRPMRVEVGWTLATLLVFLGMFSWGAIVYADLETVPEEATPIYVVGKQWMWKIQHPQGPREINELHVPTGQPIRLVMTSQDVIHSFYLPAVRKKQDVIPGRYTSLWFTADRPGVYDLFCAEYCGTDHSQMIGRFIVMDPAEFQGWLDAAATPPATAVPPTGTQGAPPMIEGRGVFYRLGCNACHARGDDDLAPRLDGIFGRPVRLENGRNIVADEQYIRESILNPNAKISAGYPSPSIMPSYRGLLTEEEMLELIEFIRSIRHGWPSEEDGETGEPGTGSVDEESHTESQTGTEAIQSKEAGSRPRVSGEPALPPSLRSLRVCSGSRSVPLRAGGGREG